MDKLRLPDSDFALTTDALDFMQKAYNYLENISLIGGQSYMLSGGEESNGVAADGIVVLNGEVMPFKGGSVQTNIRVVTVTSDVSVGVAQRQQITKYAEFGTSTNPDDNFVWADLQKSPKVADSFKLGGNNPSYYEPAFVKKTAFNKDFGGNGSAETVSRSDHTHTFDVGFKAVGRAVVNSDGTISEKKGVITSVERSSTGAYKVNHNIDSSSIKYMAIVNIRPDYIANRVVWLKYYASYISINILDQDVVLKDENFEILIIEFTGSMV